MKDPVEETIRIYEEIADEWHARYGNLDFMKDLAEIFIENVSGEKILDLGCGPGRDAKYFSEKGFQVVGIDLSEKFLGMAAKKAPRVSFKKMDMRNIDFPESHFDGVWAAASIIHIPKKEARKVLDDVNKVLKKGGVFYLSMLEGIRQDTPKIEFGSGRFFAYYDSDEIKELLSDAGFDIIEVYPSQGVINLTRGWMNIFAVKR